MAKEHFFMVIIALFFIIILFKDNLDKYVGNFEMGMKMGFGIYYYNDG